MIGKIIQSKSFSSCVSYVMNKPDAKLLGSKGVINSSVKDMIDSFELQRSLNPQIKQPVGHISLAYSVKDKERLTDSVMAQLALEYLDKMNIKNTQFVIVRHSDSFSGHPHCHIIYNRINDKGERISNKNDYKQNRNVCKQMKDKYGLTYGRGKEQVNIQRLRKPDKERYMLYIDISNALKSSKNWSDFQQQLSKENISVRFKYKGHSDVIQGVSFERDNVSYKGSDIDKNFSYLALCREMGASLDSVKEDLHQEPRFSSNAMGVIGGFLETFSGEEDNESEENENGQKRKARRR